MSSPAALWSALVKDIATKRPQHEMTERALTVYCHASGVVEQALARREPEVEEGFRGGGARRRAARREIQHPLFDPGGAQEGLKRGFNFFFRSWRRPWGQKGGSKSGFRRESLRQDVDLETIMSKMGAIIMKKLPKCAQRCPKTPTRP